MSACSVPLAKMETWPSGRSVGMHTRQPAQDERLVGSLQPQQLQTNGRHHEKALAAHNRNIYSNLGGTTIATLSPSIEAFSPLPRSSSSSLSQKSPSAGIGHRTPSHRHHRSITPATVDSHPSPPDQPPSPTPTPPPPVNVAALQTLIPGLWYSVLRLRKLLIDQVDIDKVDFHINGIFENLEIVGFTMGGDDRNTVREAAMRHEKILITPPTTPQTDTGT
ncbi:hypothetical protein BGX38DRAFT_1272364 [Terfezia claveryi]|nr:hypothetical protein BGX38DRAFT_1280420 [Terfezia claveryi]KAF8442543.1 hypothetical protein BGX38DRAFT_1272364 [Terfezia claveryi]